MSKFNLRVYGIMLNAGGEVLLSDEHRFGTDFTKFPGGGVEFGEGIADALRREFLEECGLEIEIIQHVHTTEKYIKSAFDDSQVIAVHYWVRSVKIPPQLPTVGFDAIAPQSFRWIPASQLTSADLTFEMDRLAWEVFKMSC